MQLYRGIPILTNQPDAPTHLVGVWPLDHEGSVAEYQPLAHAAIDGILDRGRVPVVVGGTGLYLRAALSDLTFPAAPTAGVRARWERLYDRMGPLEAHLLLAERDPAAAAGLHPNDRRRVVRALELAEAGGTLRPADHRLWTEKTRHPTLMIGLEVPPDELLRRIETRTRRMFEAGVEDEIRRALDEPLSTTVRQMIGLLEVAELPRTEAAAAIVRRTRRYAAYQRKLMRRLQGLVTVRGDRPPGEIVDEILHLARGRERLPAHRALRSADPAHCE
jgi:tRNA dimethylallyltransferase